MSKLKEYQETAKQQAIEYKKLEDQKFDEYEHFRTMRHKAEGAYEALSQMVKEDEDKKETKKSK
tara:strand:+ start:132 stop:323 length:192 start_codon:yes stop_codon:yes gene_type:complete